MIAIPNSIKNIPCTALVLDVKNSGSSSSENGVEQEVDGRVEDDE